MTQDDNQRLERFLKDLMTPEESDAFLNDLRNDNNLREDAQITALMIKELQERKAKEDAEIIDEVLAAKKKGKKAKIVKMVRWPLSIAAMFILIFGAVMLWNKQSDTVVLYAQANNIFEQHYSPYTLQGKSRGGDSDTEKELSILFNQVGTEEDVSLVIEKLQKIHDSIDSEYEYSLYADDISWYLALAYLKDNNVDKAKELLKPLVDDGDEDAIKLLNAIESLKE